jgi:hypothetical protein
MESEEKYPDYGIFSDQRNPYLDSKIKSNNRYPSTLLGYHREIYW